jgi:NADPH:quinone reductase-like Zn-dependent oxidoreductase
MGKCARVEAVDVGSRAMFEAMNKAIAFHRMRPVVDRVFEFDKLGEALTYLREARHFGKVCLRASFEERVDSVLITPAGQPAPPTPAAP